MAAEVTGSGSLTTPKVETSPEEEATREAGRLAEVDVKDETVATETVATAGEVGTVATEPTGRAPSASVS